MNDPNVAAINAQLSECDVLGQLLDDVEPVSRSMYIRDMLSIARLALLYASFALDASHDTGASKILRAATDYTQRLKAYYICYDGSAE